MGLVMVMGNVMNASEWKINSFDEKSALRQTSLQFSLLHADNLPTKLIFTSTELIVHRSAYTMWEVEM